MNQREVNTTLRAYKCESALQIDDSACKLGHCQAMLAGEKFQPVIAVFADFYLANQMSNFEL